MPFRKHHNIIIDDTVTDIVETVKVKTKWGTIRIVRGKKGNKIAVRAIQIPAEVPVSVAQSMARSRGARFEPATPLNPKDQML